MSELVERIARKICRADCERRDVPCSDCGEDWQAFAGAAHDTIKVIRDYDHALDAAIMSVEPELDEEEVP